MERLKPNPKTKYLDAEPGGGGGSGTKSWVSVAKPFLHYPESLEHRGIQSKPDNTLSTLLLIIEVIWAVIFGVLTKKAA
jgi:hypothetical protein